MCLVAISPTNSDFLVAYDHCMSGYVAGAAWAENNAILEIK